MSDKLFGSVKAGVTSVSIPVLLLKDADGKEKTGVAHGDVVASYWRQGGTRVAITTAALTNIDSAYSSGGWKETDATNMKGWYRLDIPNAAFFAGAEWVAINVQGADFFSYPREYAIESVGSAELWARIGAPVGASISADLAAIPLAVWNVLRSVTFTANSIGEKVKAWLATLGADNKVLLSSDAQTGVTIPTVTTVTNAPSDSAGVGTLLTRLPSVLTITSGKVDVNDKTGFALTSGERTSIASAVRTNLATELARLDENISAAKTLTTGERLAVAAAIETELMNEGTGGEFMQAIADKLAAEFDIEDLTIIAIRDAILNRVLSGNHETAGSVGKLLQNLNATISSRATPADVENTQDVLTTMLDNQPTDSEFNARTLPTGDYATVANQNTLLARLGAFTGTGLNTVLGFLRALGRKDAALTPSDMGGTYDNTSHSQQAIRERGDAAWVTGGGGGASGGAGSGARVVTVNVTDGTDPLQNATVRMSEGGNTFTATSNVSGDAVFALDDATYTLSASKANYQATPQTVVVNGTEAFEVEMTIVNTPPVALPDMAVLYVDVLDEGLAINGVRITMTAAPSPLAFNSAYESTRIQRKLTGADDVDGRASFTVYPGVIYEVLCGSMGLKRNVTAPAAGQSANVADLPDA